MFPSAKAKPTYFADLNAAKIADSILLGLDFLLKHNVFWNLMITLYSWAAAPLHEI